MSSKLDDYRKEINQIDEALYALYKKRLNVSRQVGAYKEEHGIAILDETREEVIASSIQAKYESDIDLNAYLDLHETMMRVSRNAQYPFSPHKYHVVDALKTDCTVGYQGVVGSFSSIATKTLFPQQEKKTYDTFSEVFEAVVQGEITYGVVPLENSTHGEIVEVFDLLRDVDVSVVAEVIQPIEHYLLGVAGAKREDIKAVYSHPQALAQSADYLKTHQEMKTVGSANTAMSAQMVAQKGDKTIAAIASKEAAEEYGLAILDANIENFKNNRTRFIVIAKDAAFLQKAEKTSILVTVDHKSGTLAQVVAQFRYEKINMVKITSRPIPNTAWRYQFFIDFEGNVCDEKVQRLLQRLEAEVYEMRLLGSYPIFESQ